MKRVCAWCEREIEADAQDDRVITHTICDRCYDNIAFQQGAPLVTFLDSLASPVVVVDGDGLVQTANAAACALVGKDRAAIARQPGGLVFECAYARLPGGCGRTVHCSGCTIRRAVMATFATGESAVCQPASLRPSLEGENLIELCITTEKLGNCVLLRINTFTPAHPETPRDTRAENRV